MRIIAGAWRSRKLCAPKTEATRPMPDRIREAIFGILASRYGLPGACPPFAVADLFAGSGSMGLEAISRGAASCDFIETSRHAMAALRHNLDCLHAGPCCRMMRVDAWTAALATPRPRSPYGLIVVDPPYRDARDVSPVGKVPTLLSDLFRAGWAAEDTVIVVHHEARVTHQPGERAVWRVDDRRVYGRAAVTLVVQRRDDPTNGRDAAPPQRASDASIANPETTV